MKIIKVLSLAHTFLFLDMLLFSLMGLEWPASQIARLAGIGIFNVTDAAAATAVSGRQAPPLGKWTSNVLSKKREKQITTR